jgi:ubiquinone/menaquinone biosynthesis C-methylase UbiE
MEPRLQRRIQRYGWDLAASDYEPLWRTQLASAHMRVLACASLAPGQRVLDVACGTGLIALAAAEAVGPLGEVVGADLSAQMVEALRQRARERGLANVHCVRMDAENLALPGASFDVALCALGLMFVPDPEQAVREMRRILRPGGRAVIAVWGERQRCGWSTVFPIVAAEVASDVCPLFFRLGRSDTLARVCADARFDAIELHRVATTLEYFDADEACSAAFVGGPMALAWSRFDDSVRARVRERYVASIAAWRHGRGFRIPGEFVVVSASVPVFR